MSAATENYHILPSSSIVKRLIHWSGALHWGQLLLLELGTGLAFCLFGGIGLWILTGTLDARSQLSSQDYCCDSAMFIGRIPYRWKVGAREDEKALARRDWAEADSLAPLVVAEGATQAELDDILLRRLSIVRDWRESRSEVERAGSLIRVALSVLSLSISASSFALCFAFLWWWFGARRSN